MPTPTSPAMLVHLVDYAGVPGLELARATGESSKLWSKIGVKTAWKDGEDAHAQIAARVDGVPALGVVVVILNDEMARKMIVAEHRAEGVLGRAVPEAGRAYIFYDRVKSASRQLSAVQGVLLGEVFAHELGHLLLGHNHSPDGLMRAQPDFGSPHLAFTPGDGVKIRTGILAQVAAQN
jgi:hypothetical protein